MEANSDPSYTGTLVKGLKYFSVGTFDRRAAKHSVNKIQFVIHVISWFVLEISLLGGCFDADFDEGALSFAVLVLMIPFIFKFAMFSLNRNTLHNFIKLIDSDAVSRTKTDVYVKKAVKDIARNMRSYAFVATLIGTAYIGGAIFFDKPQSQKIETKYWEVVHVYIPCDVIVFERIGVVRFTITALMIYHGYSQIFMDFVSNTLFIHVEWQFKAIADMFKNIRYSDSHEDSRIRLKEVIEYHQLILGYAAKLQKMYKVVFLMQLMGCFLQMSICMLLFVHTLKTTETSFADAVSYGSHMLLCSFQLFMYARCADMTKESALLVSEGIYLSNWYLAPPSTRRDLTWILTRAQHPINYSAMGLFPMSVETFNQVMHSAYGAFSLMTSMD